MQKILGLVGSMLFSAVLIAQSECPDPSQFCGLGTSWDDSTQTCVVTKPADTNFDGCVQLNDLLDVLSEYGYLDAIGVCGGSCMLDVDGDGVCDDVDPCIGIEDALGECNGGCLADEDLDGICDDIDNCIGVVDTCGFCNGQNVCQLLSESDNILVFPTDTHVLFQIQDSDTIHVQSDFVATIYLVGGEVEPLAAAEVAAVEVAAAGGVLVLDTLLMAGEYVAIVGAGGEAGGSSGSNGGDTEFLGTSALGGGGGGGCWSSQSGAGNVNGQSGSERRGWRRVYRMEFLVVDQGFKASTVEMVTVVTALV